LISLNNLISLNWVAVLVKYGERPVQCRRRLKRREVQAIVAGVLMVLPEAQAGWLPHRPLYILAGGSCILCKSL
jgi:hypothetical protein